MRLFFVLPKIFGFRVVVDPSGSSSPAPRAPGAFIYVVAGDHGLSKIGVTTSPAARLATLRTSSPFPIAFSHLWSVDAGAFAIEQTAHAMLSRHRCQGEWFDVAPEIAAGAVAAAAESIGQHLTPETPDGRQPPPLRDGGVGEAAPHARVAMIAIPATIAALGWFEIAKLGIDWPVVAVANGLGLLAIGWITLAVARRLG